MSTPLTSLRPRCVGTTANVFCKGFQKKNSSVACRGHGDAGESNLFREAQFSGDGTTIVTHNEDQCLRTFVLPEDLLREEDGPRQLSMYSTFASPSNIQSYAIYPFFNLQDPSTTLVLSGSRDQPIALRNALDYGYTHGQYSLIHPLREDYLIAYSLSFTRDGNHFIAGSNNQIATFDCSRTAEGPMMTSKTGVSRKERKLYGKSGMTSQGPVSALSISGDGILAAGTYEREVGLYGSEGSGEHVTAFSLARAETGEQAVRATGVTSIKWSPCGKYLIIAERQSDLLQMYDVRNTLQRVSLLTGRKANTTQRLGMDVVPTANGFEVWAGGTDGVVRMWSNPGSMGGEHTADAKFKLHDDPVSGTIWHPDGAILATCSGQRSLPGISFDSPSDEEDARMYPYSTQIDRIPDNTLQTWTV